MYSSKPLKNAIIVFIILHSFKPGSCLDIIGKNPFNTFLDPRTLKQSSVAENCECEGLACSCCVSLDTNKACLVAIFAPADLTLYFQILANDQPVYENKIDSGKFPICAPVFPPACWAFNRIHIDKDNVQVCSEVRIGPVPILKVPCLAYAGGNLITSPNNY